VDLLPIGEFARRALLSAKALRLYDELGLLRPARVDPVNGYRWYRPDQVDRARLVARLRRLDMPLARIAGVLDLDGPAAAAVLDAYRAEAEARSARSRADVAHLRELLRGGRSTMPDLPDPAVRSVPDRTLLSLTRHAHADELGEILGSTLTAFRHLAPAAPLTWPDNCPFVVYYGEVSADGDGPVELCRPVDPDDPGAAGLAAVAAAAVPGATVRREPAHDEVYLRLPRAGADDPRLLEGYAVLERWCARHGREPAGAPRQVLIADWRTAGPGDPAFDLAVRLR
jgi:DNA-binding transcriptional MerR regulator